MSEEPTPVVTGVPSGILARFWLSSTGQLQGYGISAILALYTSIGGSIALVGIFARELPTAQSFTPPCVATGRLRIETARPPESTRTGGHSRFGPAPEHAQRSRIPYAGETRTTRRFFDITNSPPARWAAFVGHGPIEVALSSVSDCTSKNGRVSALSPDGFIPSGLVAALGRLRRADRRRGRTRPPKCREGTDRPGVSILAWAVCCVRGAQVGETGCRWGESSRLTCRSRGR